jgi:hypothetical protein
MADDKALALLDDGARDIAVGQVATHMALTPDRLDGIAGQGTRVSTGEFPAACQRSKVDKGSRDGLGGRLKPVTGRQPAKAGLGMGFNGRQHGQEVRLPMTGSCIL